jgi:mono/diheme cytochrome c family protein
MAQKLAAFLLFTTVSVVQAQQQEALQALRSCTACHNATMAQGNLRLDTLEAIGKGGLSGAVLKPGDAANSLLIKRATSTEPAMRMPPTGAMLDTAKVEAVKRWIDAGAPGLSPTIAAVNRKVDFDAEVEPILKANCNGCHSGASAKGQLRLDAGSTAMRVITPGKAEESRIIHRVEGRGNERRMPLGGQPLKPAEIAILRDWINSGASWPAAKMQDKAQKHWAYVKPVKHPTINSIDGFLLTKLKAFSPEASRETLIRRVSLDLTGLPPTPAEVDAFLADQSPNAYAKLVDRLLASPQYGERWARPWLDLARYADTNGFEKDLRRSMWKYRDWVIDALNKDMGFDQFTIEQLAGDMLPNPTNDQKIATGFHRNTMYNEEGGVDKEEAHFEVLVDRVNTTGMVWLGATTACHQCHNHKYDPFTHKEYYQMMAFFSNTAKDVREYGDTSIKWIEPKLELPSPEQARKREELTTRQKALEEKLKTNTPEITAEQTDWSRTVLASYKEWTPVIASKLTADGGAVLKQDAPTALIMASGPNPLRETYTIESKVNKPQITGLRIEAVPAPGVLPRNGPGRDAYGNFILTRAQVEVNGKPVEVSRYLADDGRVNTATQLWIVDASKEDERLPRQMVLVFKEPVKLTAEAVVRLRLSAESDLVGQSLGQFRVSVSSSYDPSAIVKVRHNLRPLLDSGSDPEQKLATYFRTISTKLAPVRDELREIRNQLDRLDIPSALIMAEGPDTPSDFVRIRGGFSAKADKVFADVPAVLGGLPPDLPRNRLGLAKWLVSRENPLTARVTVNRIWEQYFGRGLVETPEDFGSQGERPTHPELLDWLAVELMDHNWSLKHIHRLIATSTAYKQTSRVTPELLQSDPYNRLISRGPRFRMEAEMIRDTALASSGLLSRKVGGPSVFPYQPPGIWDVPYSDDKWIESKGEDRYRRGLYTFVRRSAMYPSMLNFDATSREQCVVRRVRTNTPMQALTTLNDPAFFETAQALARRIQAEATSEADRVKLGFRLVTARAAKPAEVDRLLSWRQGEVAYFKSHTDEATKLGGDAEKASWTMLANVLLNLDEALTKE